MLILNADSKSSELHVPEERRVAPSVVRSLIGPARHVFAPELPAPMVRALKDQEITAPYTMPVESSTVPTVVADVDLMLTPLHPFEAYVLSFIDGSTPVGQLAKHARLEELEVQVVLNSLLERNLIQVPNRPAPTEAARPVWSPPPAGPEGSRRPESVLQQAIALERRGDIDAAIQVLERGVARLSEAAALYNRLALVVAAHGRDSRKAEELLRKAVQLDPENPVYVQNLAKVAGQAASGPGGAPASVAQSRLKKSR